MLDRDYDSASRALTRVPASKHNVSPDAFSRPPWSYSPGQACQTDDRPLVTDRCRHRSRHSGGSVGRPGADPEEDADGDHLDDRHRDPKGEYRAAGEDAV